MAAAIPLPTAQVAIWEYEDNGNWLLMKEEYAYIYESALREQLCFAIVNNVEGRTDARYYTCLRTMIQYRQHWRLDNWQNTRFSPYYHCDSRSGNWKEVCRRFIRRHVHRFPIAE